MKKTAAAGIPGMMLIFSLAFIGCDNGSTSSIDGNITGTWSGPINSHPGSVTADAINWVLSVPDAGLYDVGTYTMANNTAILYSSLRDGEAVNVGTAYVTDGNTMSITLNSNSVALGTYTLTRKSYYELED
jgi:hypothetical protein